MNPANGLPSPPIWGPQMHGAYAGPVQFRPYGTGFMQYQVGMPLWAVVLVSFALLGAGAFVGYRLAGRGVK